MAHNVAVTTVTEGQPLNYVLQPSDNNQDGNLFVVGDRLYHFKHGLTFDYLELDSDTWVNAAYTTLGLTGEQVFAYSFKSDNGAILVTTEGFAFEYTASGIVTIGYLDLPKNGIHGAGCQSGNYLYFAGVDLRDVNGGVVPYAYTTVVNRTTGETVVDHQMENGLYYCYPDFGISDSGVCVSFNVYDSATETYTVKAWGVNDSTYNVVSFGGLVQEGHIRPHIPVTINGYVCWAIGAEIYRWKAALGTEMIHTLPESIASKMGQAGDYVDGHGGFYSKDVVYYSSDAATWEEAPIKTLPSEVTQAVVATFHKPDETVSVVNNAVVASFVRPSDLFATNATVATFHKDLNTYVPIVNPDAAVDVSGWTVTTGVLDRKTDGGGYFFGGNVQYSQAEQEVDLTTVATAAQLDSSLQANLSWEQNSYGGDDMSRIILVALDGLGGAELGRLEPTLMATPNGTWTLRQEQYTLPVGTRAVKLIMDFERIAGTNSDGYIDNIRLGLLL